MIMPRKAAFLKSPSHQSQVGCSLSAGRVIRSIRPLSTPSSIVNRMWDRGSPLRGWNVCQRPSGEPATAKAVQKSCVHTAVVAQKADRTGNHSGHRPEISLPTKACPIALAAATRFCLLNNQSEIIDQPDPSNCRIWIDRFAPQFTGLKNG
jgi:hypothetical protein